LAGSLNFVETCMCIARHDGSIIKEVQDAARLSCQDDLLFGTLDSGGKVNVVGLFELLARLVSSVLFSQPWMAGPTHNICKLCLCNQALGLGADKLLLKLDNLSTLWLLVFQLGYLIRHLSHG
jgi:hypothetical protein